MNAIYETTVKLLGDVVSPASLRMCLDEGLARLGRSADTVGLREMEKVLKSSVYRQLQVALPAAVAKARVQQALNAIADLVPAEGAGQRADANTLERQAAAMPPLEDSLKRFNLYFEWPEVQKFRSQLQVLRDEHGAGKAAPGLVRDAQVQLEGLERKLSDLLVRQARDLAEVQADLERVRSVGGPRVRRLDSLVKEIADAHAHDTLAPAEVERARKLAADLRKLVESAVVQPLHEAETDRAVWEAEIDRAAAAGPTSGEAAADDALVVEDAPARAEPADDAQDLLEVEYAAPAFEIDLADLTPEQSERVKDVDLREDLRALETTLSDHRSLLAAEPDLAAAVEQLLARNRERQVLTREIGDLREAMTGRTAILLAAQRARLAELPAVLDRLEQAGLGVREARVTLAIAQGVAGSAALATDDLATLEDLVRTLERQHDERERERRLESGRLERALARQSEVLAETRALGQALSPLGAAANAPLAARLAELELETAAGRARDDLVQGLAADAASLQEQLGRAGPDPARAETEGLGDDRAREREAGRLRGLRLALASLPENPDLQSRSEGLRARLDEAARRLSAGELLGERLDGIAAALRELELAHRAAAAERLDDLERRARLENADGTVRAIQDARADMESGRRPELGALEARLRAHHEARLIAQRRDLAELETVARDLAAVPQAASLSSTLAAARLEHEAGRLVDLAPALAEARDLRAAEEAALADWGTRVDALVAEAVAYRGIGGETVRELGRAADLLNAERGLEGVSPGTRLQLEQSLGRAEDLLAQAREEYAAASMVAAALKDGSQIDDLLGVFSLGGATGTPAAIPDSLADQDLEGLPDGLRDWLRAVSGERGVQRVALVRGDGSLRAGRLERAPQVAAMLRETQRSGSELARELHRAPARLYGAEFDSGALIAVFLRPQDAGPGSGLTLVLLLEDAGLSSRLFAQAHRDYAQLRDWAAAA